jgi:Uma2 family endonuclease
VVIVEIISPNDRRHYVMEKLEEYRLWGVEHILVIDPRAKRFWIYTERWLRSVSSLALPNCPFELTPSVLFSDL